MNEQLKKRLIGATVLVLLAVIFVPMLFNSGEKTEMPTFGSNVPPRPDGKFQTIEVPLQTPAPQPAETQPVTTAKEGAALDAQAAAAPAVTPANPAPAPVAAPAPAPVVAAAPAPAPAVQPAPAAPKVAAPAAAKTPATRPASGWAVQVGNFTKSANALATRDKLRKKGFTAYVEHQKGTYLVRVGPELKRDNADALKVRLEKAGYKGFVVTHP